MTKISKIRSVERWPATPAGATTTSSSSRPMTASSAGASSTRVSARPASARRSSGCRRAWSARTRSQHERIYAELYCATRPAAGGVVAQALGAIENALLDAKAKALGVPCYELLGGKIRDRIRVYWSHCATWRINHPDWYKPAITDLDGVKAIGREVREKRLHRAEDQHLPLRPTASRRAGGPASARRSSPRSTSTARCCATCACISKRSATAPGPTSTSCSTSTSTPRPRAISRSCARSPTSTCSGSRSTASAREALGYIRRQSPHPISSCETLLGLREFLPYFREQAMDVAIIDTPWNGVWQSMKIAAAAEALRGQRRPA